MTHSADAATRTPNSFSARPKAEFHFPFRDSKFLITQSAIRNRAMFHKTITTYHF